MQKNICFHCRIRLVRVRYTHVSFFAFSDPKTDQYIARSLRELMALYFPNILASIKSYDEMPLLKFFEEKPDDEVPERVVVLELIVSTFLSKRNRTPDNSVAQVGVPSSSLVRSTVPLEISNFSFCRS